MKAAARITRRDFLKAGAAAGGGLLIGFWLPAAGHPAETTGKSPPASSPNAWLRIGRDDRVTVLVSQSEMGQGVLTSLPMLVAEELEVDWSAVGYEAAPADTVYYNPQLGMQLTGGSTSVRAFWEPLRKAGAMAREMLIAAAAETWAVSPKACRADRGAVIHPPSGRSLRYGALAERASQLKPPAAIRLKKPKEFTVIGKRVPRLDTPRKVSGSGIFGIDVKVPGMLVASVSRCPVFGGRVASFDASKARGAPGVRHIVQIDSGIAVVADSFWQAQQGREALEVTWDEGPNADLDSAEITRRYAAAAEQPGEVARKAGDAARALAKAARKIEAVYQAPYLSHATMEPMNCTARVRRDSCDIWVGTQAQTMVQRTAARITGLPAEAISVHTTLLGGGFGRRAEQDFVAEALQISRAVGAPVKVIWTREDDIQHDRYRPATYHRLSAGLDAHGMPVAWMHRIVGPSLQAAYASWFPSMELAPVDHATVDGAVNLPYAIPNLQIECVRVEPGVPVGVWRSVGSSQNAYVTECFLDELAAAAGKDPVELRRRLLRQSPRHKAVLELAATRAGWGTRLPEGRHRGIAVHASFGSFVAQAAEVSVAENGAVQVHRIVCAIDCGTVVNPDTVRAQMEGGIVFGLTAVLHGEITIEHGRVKQSNFHDYPMLRIHGTPVIEVHIVPSTAAPGGVGETSTPPIAPAVANAVFAATGKRVRRLPIRAEELKRA